MSNSYSGDDPLPIQSQSTYNTVRSKFVDLDAVLKGTYAEKVKSEINSQPFYQWSLSTKIQKAKPGKVKVPKRADVVPAPLIVRHRWTIDRHDVVICSAQGYPADDRYDCPGGCGLEYTLAFVRQLFPDAQVSNVMDLSIMDLVVVKVASLNG